MHIDNNIMVIFPKMMRFWLHVLLLHLFLECIITSYIDIHIINTQMNSILMMTDMIINRERVGFT